MSDKSCPVPETFRSMFWSILYLTLVFFSYIHKPVYLFSAASYNQQ